MDEEHFQVALDFLIQACAGQRYVGRKMIKILADAAGQTEKDTESFYLARLQQGIALPPLVISDDLFDPPTDVRFI